jgi:cytoskeletal protein CcmA (bactofilin family)
MGTESTIHAQDTTARAAGDLRMTRPGRAMIGMFAAVAIGAALIGALNRATRGAAAAREAAPMRMGSLTVHGPLRVNGNLAISGEMVVHGPVRARRIDRAPASTLPVREKTGPRTIDGPMKVEQSLVVDGDLRVDGPLSVAGDIKVSEIAADGPVHERSTL